MKSLLHTISDEILSAHYVTACLSTKWIFRVALYFLMLISFATS